MTFLLHVFMEEPSMWNKHKVLWGYKVIHCYLLRNTSPPLLGNDTTSVLINKFEM